MTVRIAAVGATKSQLERAISLGAQRQLRERRAARVRRRPSARGARGRRVRERSGAVRYLEVSLNRPRLPSQAIGFPAGGGHGRRQCMPSARGPRLPDRAELDQDSAFTANHIRVLLQTLRSERADFAYGIAVTEWPNATGAGRAWQYVKARSRRRR